MELISVIIPYHNTEPFLFDACLSSLKNQTYSSWELIVIDDRSTPERASYADAAVESVCEAGIPARILHLQDEPGGVSRARNAGIDLACGEYLCFVDSDDVVHPDYLMGLYTCIRETGADIAVARNREVRCAEELEQALGTTYPSHEGVRYDGPELLRQMQFGYCTNKLFRRETVGDIRFDTSLTLLEDALFSVEVLDKAGNCCVLDEDLYFYRKNAGSTGATLRSDKFIAAVEATDRLLPLPLIASDKENREVMAAFRSGWRFRYLMAIVTEKKTGWRKAFREQKKLLRQDKRLMGKQRPETLVRVSLYVAWVPFWLYIPYIKLLNRVRLRHWKRISDAWTPGA
ncbi:MAG: glycosyltransferase family 2 protein [Eubacteriales bacterium]